MKANFKQPNYGIGEKEPFKLIGVEKNWRSEKDRTMGDSWHDDLEITFNVARIANYYIDGKEYYLTPGMFIVTNCGSLHGYIIDEKAECQLKPEDCVKIEGIDYELGALSILISPAFMENNFPRYKEMFFTNENMYPSEEVKNILIQLCRCAKDEGADEYIRVHRKALILELVYHLCLENQVIAKPAEEELNKNNLQRIKDIITYIEENYSTHITQEEVAKKFYFTPSYFSRYFFKYIGENFSDYLRKFRVANAKTLLLTTDLSIAEIAAKCGFYDDRRFILAYKREYGDTPLQYKKKHFKDR